MVISLILVHSQPMFFQEILGKLFLIGVNSEKEQSADLKIGPFDNLPTEQDEVLILNSQKEEVKLLNKGETCDYEKLRQNLTKNYEPGIITRNNMSAIVRNIFLNRAPFDRVGKPGCCSFLPKCCLTRETTKRVNYHAHGM